MGQQGAASLKTRLASPLDRGTQTEPWSWEGWPRTTVSAGHFWQPTDVETWVHVDPADPGSQLLQEVIIEYQNNPPGEHTYQPQAFPKYMCRVYNAREVGMAWADALQKVNAWHIQNAHWSSMIGDLLLQESAAVIGASAMPFYKPDTEVETADINHQNDMMWCMLLYQLGTNGADMGSAGHRRLMITNCICIDELLEEDEETAVDPVASWKEAHMQGQDDSKSMTLSGCRPTDPTDKDDNLPLAAGLVNQLYTHMATNCVLFGMITSWRYTWLARLVPDNMDTWPWTGKLYLSPAIFGGTQHTAEHPMVTAMGAVSWLSHRAFLIGKMLPLPTRQCKLYEPSSLSPQQQLSDVPQESSSLPADTSAGPSSTPGCKLEQSHGRPSMEGPSTEAPVAHGDGELTTEAVSAGAAENGEQLQPEDAEGGLGGVVGKKRPLERGVLSQASQACMPCTVTVTAAAAAAAAAGAAGKDAAGNAVVSGRTEGPQPVKAAGSASRATEGQQPLLASQPLDLRDPATSKPQRTKPQEGSFARSGVLQIEKFLTSYDLSDEYVLNSTVYGGTCNGQAARIKLHGPSAFTMKFFYREWKLLRRLAKANVQAAPKLLGVGYLYLGVHVIATEHVTGQLLSCVKPITQEVANAAVRALTEVHAVHPKLLQGCIMLENMMLVQTQSSATADAANGTTSEGNGSAALMCKFVDFGFAIFGGSPGRQQEEMQQLQRLLKWHAKDPQ